jgi:hypothetical protein
MIEVRALLRKDAPPSLKEGNLLPEKKSIVSSVPRGTSDPSLLLLLVSAFAEKLKIHHENEQNAQFLVRRKFFEELKAVRPKNLLCLSLETPTENFLSPDTISSEEVQKLLEWIRKRVESASWEEVGCPIIARPVLGKEKWMVLRLDKPFFHDLFLCANQSKP